MDGEGPHHEMHTTRKNVGQASSLPPNKVTDSERRERRVPHGDTPIPTVSDLALPNDTARYRRGLQWLVLALCALFMAGLFAPFPVAARVPGIAEGLDPSLAALAKRMLIVHVNLALVIWFCSFITALLYFLPCRVPMSLPQRMGWPLAATGTVALVLSICWPESNTILNNYIPTLDNSLFLFGLGAFGLSVFMSLIHPRLYPTTEVAVSPVILPESARPGVRAAAVIVVLAVVTMLIALFQMSPAAYHDTTLNPDQNYDLYRYNMYYNIFWSGGHVMQAANVAAMMAAWLVLLTNFLGREPISRKTAAVVFTLLVLPQLLGPAFVLMANLPADTASFRIHYTRLMQFAIFPQVLLMFGLCVYAIMKAGREGALKNRSFITPAFVGFAASAGLTLSGFVFGAFISGDNLMVPAHYHASIGGVTVSFMAVTYMLLEKFGIVLPTRRIRLLATWQPLLFGVGQVTLVIGFWMAGLGGIGRKMYGAEQNAHTPEQILGLTIMGIGGALALPFGFMFIWIVFYSWRKSEWNRRHALPPPVDERP